MNRIQAKMQIELKYSLNNAILITQLNKTLYTSLFQKTEILGKTLEFPRVKRDYMDDNQRNENTPLIPALRKNDPCSDRKLARSLPYSLSHVVIKHLTRTRRR